MEEQLRVKVIAIAKDEAAYIPQWIHHHLHFGFDAVELWLNDISDNSLALLRKIQAALGADVVSIVEADDVLERCIKTRRHFQEEAYNLAYQREVKQGAFTHLMFLDLDELWTPANFEDSVKDVLRRYPQSDSISFLWMVDLPDRQRKSFCRPFYLENKFQRNRHVKSLARISPNIQKIGIHNHVVKDGVFHLSDGTAFEPSPDVLRVGWSYISLPQVKARLKQPEPYFIVHQIYRSKEEYLSSLLRGRRHTGDREHLFKTNRQGYLPMHDETHTESIRVSEANLRRYDSGYQDFIKRTGLPEVLRAAQDFIVERCESAFAAIKDDPSMLVKYEQQLRGLPDVQAKAEGDSIVGKIEATLRASQTDCVEIRGWAADVGRNRPLKFQFQDDAGQLAALFSQRVARPDLYEKTKPLGLDCGFRLEISPEQAAAIESGIAGNVFEIIAKTFDGKARHVFSIEKSALRPASDVPNPKMREPYGEVSCAEVQGGMVQFSGQVNSGKGVAVQVYAAMDSLLFPLAIGSYEQAAPGAMTFAASLELARLPGDLQAKVPRIYAAINGRACPLSIGESYAYPASDVASFYRAKLPTAAFSASLPREEHASLLEHLPGKKTYLTYGAPDTASLALQAGAQNIVAVDSDAAVSARLNEHMAVAIRNTSRNFFPVHVNLGKTKELGYPVDDTGWKAYPTYASLAWELCEAKGISPDLVLIDARFRVACFLVSVMMAKPGAVLLFDDYSDRPQYHVVERVLKPVERYGRMAKFVVPEQVNLKVGLALLLRYCSNAF
ncbi:Uncharacterised protein [Bordetella ansorpii]|uniref:Glycosyl transferase family 2 n=1 Tax=Bordetella ansorpii TaxID=288768 RepID=A0A157M945_9BORD|nr:glycosyltransferase family 2 protein [Bordetella ansorpii]SAI05645.1 Uncharacterised protein [Bordetella ansorpii]